MPKRRANGEGNIRKRKDGRWEGRYTVGHDPETGKAIIKNVLGKTQAEVKEKLKKAIEENAGIDYGRAKTYTAGSWLEVWMENYAKVKLRPSTYKTSQGFLKNHIKPQIGSVPLADLTSLDLQRFYKHLLDGGRVDRIEAPLKTKNAYRTLPLSADAISVLKMQKCKVGNSEWVFPSPTGGPMSPDSVLHMLQRVLKRAGLPRIRFHDLRHTFATMALQNGVDVKTVSSMLGHYSAGFTLDTYAHVTTDAQLKAAQTMGNILSHAV